MAQFSIFKSEISFFRMRIARKVLESILHINVKLLTYVAAIVLLSVDLICEYSFIIILIHLSLTNKPTLNSLKAESVIPHTYVFV